MNGVEEEEKIGGDNVMHGNNQRVVWQSDRRSKGDEASRKKKASGKW